MASSGKGKEKVVEEPINNSSRDSCTTLGPFPPGYRFDPTDEELIVYYLRPKVNNMSLPPNKMHEIDLYNPRGGEEYNPDQLCAHYEAQGDRVLYLFTPRDRKYPNGSRPCRSSGTGAWKASGKDEDITSNGVVVGKKRTLNFIDKTRNFPKTNWIMYEYRLNYDETNKPQLDKSSTSKRIKLDDWVLCRIYENNRRNKHETGSKIPAKETRYASSNASPNSSANLSPNSTPKYADMTNPTQSASYVDNQFSRSNWISQHSNMQPQFQVPPMYNAPYWDGGAINTNDLISSSGVWDFSQASNNTNYGQSSSRNNTTEDVTNMPLPPQFSGNSNNNVGYQGDATWISSRSISGSSLGSTSLGMENCEPDLNNFVDSFFADAQGSYPEVNTDLDSNSLDWPFP